MFTAENNLIFYYQCILTEIYKQHFKKYKVLI